jgi:arabinose-5-phosphate isomerase
VKTSEEIIQIGKQTLQEEARALESLIPTVGESFASAVQSIIQSPGRVVITGIGKSAIIASKIVSTFNSTGTPAIFMHAADAIHGDLGTIQREDIILCISNSGNTPEIKVLLPLLKMSGNTLIAIVGNPDSFLAKEADLSILAQVEKEACPNNLAPTSSTTAQLAMGDALAVALLECRGFSQSDFARFHPGGALGRKLYLRVSDLCSQNQVPAVQMHAALSEVIIEISSRRLGATAVLDGERLAGVITDGDIRRMLQKNMNLQGIVAADIMSPSCKTINADARAVDALALMRSFNITQLLVLDKDNYVGVVHLHDILKEGII